MSNSFTLDLEKFRPDAAKTKKEHDKSIVFGSVFGALSLGAIGWAASLGRETAFPAAAVAAAAAVIGGILGGLAGKTSRTYDEQVFALVNNAAQLPDPNKALQQMLYKELRRRDEETAIAASFF